MRRIILTIITSFAIKVFANGLPSVYLLHINGINTTRAEAMSNLSALRQTSKVQNQSNIVFWDLVYNPTNDGTDTLISNLADVMNQKALEDNIITFDDYMTNYILFNNLDIKPDTPQYIALESEIKPDYELAYSEAAGDNFDTVLDEFHSVVPPSKLASALNLIKGSSPSYKDSNSYVVLIPHSQGNLYANSLVTHLISEEGFNENQIAIYGIASPASTNDGDWTSDALEQLSIKYKVQLGNVDSYITSSNDLVIAGVSVLWDVLQDNITIPLSSADKLGHNLIQIYLSDPTSSAQISKMINLDVFAMTWLDISNDINQAGLRMEAWSGASVGGGVVDPNLNVVCADGVCDSKAGYFTFNQLEQSIIDAELNGHSSLQYDFNTLYFFSKLDFPEGTYTTLDTYNQGYDIYKIGLMLDFMPNVKNVSTTALEVDQGYSPPICLIDQWYQNGSYAHSFSMESTSNLDECNMSGISDTYFYEWNGKTYFFDSSVSL